MKILVNAITLDNANIVPLLIRLKYWQSQENQIVIFGNEYLEKSDLLSEDCEKFDYVRLENRYVGQKNIKDAKSRIQFMSECLKRNILALFFVRRIWKRYDWIYSISAVLDVVLFPYIMKLFDKKIRWAVVFDNVVTFSGVGSKRQRFLAWLFFRLSLFCIRKADVVFAISEDLKKYLVSSGFAENKIIITGNAVEAERIKQAATDDRYAFDGLFVGRINEAKGIFDLLHILQVIKEKYPNFGLAIMGDGDEESKEKFKEKIHKMNLSENITLLGYKVGQEKYNIIKSSKCFIFPSRKESFGIALLEAVCSGLPAFAYDLPQFLQIYGNMEVDFSLNGQWEQIAQKVIALFEKGVFKNENGEKLLSSYSWNRIAQIEYEQLKKI